MYKNNFELQQGCNHASHIMDVDSTHISEVLGLHNVSHKNIDFVDIVLAPDTKLFLDPCLIEFGKSVWTANVQKTISSYFDRFYDLYRTQASNNEKLTLFSHTHEINATRLGYGNGHNGKAKTPQGMLDTFHTIPILLNSGIEMSQANDLVIFIRDFAEDCLSDMLTNIILKELMDFTLEQCQKYGKKTQDAPDGYFYWSSITEQWEQYRGPCLLVNGKPVLLVPKSIVRNRYYFSANQFFTRIILSRIREDQSWVDANGKVQRLPINQLRKKYQADKSTLDCTISMTEQTPLYLSEYHRQLPALYSGQGMSDEELDEILY